MRLSPCCVFGYVSPAEMEGSIIILVEILPMRRIGFFGAV